jgi:pimeloyl-ACP methyl ester carboxylesterase
MARFLIIDRMYPIQKHSRSEFVPIRTLSYHVRVWGTPGPGKVPLVLMHGWMDVAASYQFMVDALTQDHYVIAPDWRGYGLTACPGIDNYWFPDYLADLDALLDHYAPDQVVNLVGHSMGGNVVMQYAGVRPERIRRLVNLEGFGMPQTRPAQAPGRYAKWLDQLKSLHQGELALRPYDSVDGVARRLMKTNPRLARDDAGRHKAEWLAPQWARQNAAGQWEIMGDAAHKIINANLYQVEEVQAIFARITAPTLCVEATDNSLDFWHKGKYTLAEYRERIKAVPNLQTAKIDDAGHMLHHDQPEALARLIEGFIA